jgi:chemotaxis protein MotB
MGRFVSTLILMVVAVAAAVAALFFLYYEPQTRELEKARREASLCVQERSTLKSRVSDLESMLGELKQESAGLAEQVRVKEEELAKVQTTQDELIAGLQEEIANGQIQVERLRGQLRVDVVDEILFDSGDATVKPAGKDVLRKVGAVLASAERQIRVLGHTDDVPITGHLAEKYPTNWELSAARAVNMVRFLHEEAGLAPERLSASAQSQYHPRVSNETADGRQRNRRIEILLEPPLVEGPTESTAPGPAPN